MTESPPDAPRACTVTKFGTRDEWLAWRRFGVGASEAGKVLGIVPGGYEVWLEKTGALPPREPSLPMRRGQQLEAAILGIYREEHEPIRRDGLIVLPCPLVGCQSVAVPAARCSPDALVAAHGAAPIYGVDAKSWDPGGAGQWGENTMPLSLRAQGMFSCAVTGLARWDFAVLFGARRFGVWSVERDDALCEEMLARVGEWYRRHVNGRTPPDIGADEGERALAALRRKLGEVHEEMVPCTAADLELVERLLAAERVRKVAKAVGDQLRARIADRLPAATVLGIAGAGKRGKDLTLATFRAPKTSPKTDWKRIVTDLRTVFAAKVAVDECGPWARRVLDEVLTELETEFTETPEPARRLTVGALRSPAKLPEIARALLLFASPEDTGRVSALLDRLARDEKTFRVGDALQVELLAGATQEDDDDDDGAERGE